MTTSIGTRKRNNTVFSGSSNNSRRDVSRTAMPDSHVVGTDISFTAPATISSVAAAFGLLSVGQIIRVKGSALNSRDYRVETSSAAAITVSQAVISTEAAGANISVRLV